MQDFYEKMIFIAGLNADIRVKVMEVTPKFAYDALRVAIATETLILDKKDNLKAPIKISAIKQMSPKTKKKRKKMKLKLPCSTRSTQSGCRKARRPSNGFPEINRGPTETETEMGMEHTTELDPRRRTGSQ